MSLLQIRTPISPRLPRPAMLLFNRPSRGILPRFSRPSILCKKMMASILLLTNRNPQMNNATDSKYLSSANMINYSSAVIRDGTVDIQNCSGA